MAPEKVDARELDCYLLFLPGQPKNERFWGEEKMVGNQGADTREDKIEQK